MADMDLETFYKEYVKALDGDVAAVFVGAGVSRASGFVDWKGLMREIAQELGLDVNQESDLVAVAQYHVNERGGRHKINQLILSEFTEGTASTENHGLIASLPIRTIWTTNYDKLIENAFIHANKRPDVKIKQTDLALTKPNRDVTIYKMHGDVDNPDDAVLTRDDYEAYDESRLLFSEGLKGDLISKTFLFLGFSFTDPNIDYILSRVRILMGRNRREHYCIMKRLEKPSEPGEDTAQYEYDTRKMELRIADLKRYGIQTLLVDDYGDITVILRELNRRSHLRSVFVSGSAYDYSPRGRDEVEVLARNIGRSIIAQGLNLVSGFGLGIGELVALGALESVYADERIVLSDRVSLRPFPQSPPEGLDIKQFWKKYREDMISGAGFTVFICGNKLDKTTGDTRMADGVLQEYEITKALGKYPIPIGATGHAARQIWEEVSGSLDVFYPDLDVSKYFETLGDTNRTTQELVAAVFAIVKLVTKKRGG